MAMSPQSRRPGLTLAILLKPHAWALTVGIVAVFIEGAAALAEPWPLKVVLDNVLKSKPGHTWINQFIFATTADRNTVLQWAALAVLMIAAIGATANYAERYITASLGQWIMHDLRDRLYSHIQHLSLGFHTQKQTGDLITRLTTDIDAIQSFITAGLLGALINGVTLLGMIGVMFFLSPRFTMISLSIAPLLFFVVFHYTRRIKRATRDVRRKEGEMVSVIQEALSSMHVVKAFGREEYEQRRLAEESRESIHIALKVRGLKVKLSPMVDIIVSAGTCLVLWFGGKMALAGALSAGSLVLFTWYLGRMYKPMRELAKTSDAYTRAVVGYERIREVLQMECKVTDIPGARPAPEFKGSVEFEGVTFGYTPGLPILKDVSFTIEPGTVAALVGPTGAGKSTIVNLIPRLYDPDLGTVKIDGTDVRLFQQESLRNQIGFVLQDTLLFRAPVWYNIAYGNPTASRAEIERAAHLANAHEFVAEMPQGYDTVIGERGVTLSGGQRQRIAIARAIIRNSPILILDEPSTGLDAASEKLVLDAVGRLMCGRTAIVIAHKLETIRSADVIFVVSDGEIVERGKHPDLLRNRGLYANLCAPSLERPFKAGTPAFERVCTRRVA
jgi:ATP-binding cassette subfamily B protein